MKSLKGATNYWRVLNDLLAFKYRNFYDSTRKVSYAQIATSSFALRNRTDRQTDLTQFRDMPQLKFI